MSSIASIFFIKKYLKIAYARAQNCTQPFSAPLPPYPKENGKTSDWKLYGHVATPSDVMSRNDKLFLGKHYYYHDPEGFNESV